MNEEISRGLALELDSDDELMEIGGLFAEMKSNFVMKVQEILPIYEIYVWNDPANHWKLLHMRW